MADELKIPVSAPGALKATQDLAAVAAAEKQVGQAAQASGAAAKAATPAVDDHTQSQDKQSGAARELSMRHKTLLRDVAALGPEFQVAAEGLNVLVNAENSAVMAMGLVGVTIMAVGQAVSMLSGIEQEKKQRAAQVIEQLVKERDSYLEIAAAVEKAAEVESHRNQITSKPTEQAIGQIAGEAKATGMGKAEIQGVAEAQAAGNILSGEDRKTMELWFATGHSPGKSPRENRDQFFSDLKTYPNLKTLLEGELAASRARTPSEYYTRGVEAEGVAASVTPVGKSAKAMQDILAANKAHGGDWKTDPAEEEAYIGRLVARYVDTTNAVAREKAAGRSTSWEGYQNTADAVKAQIKGYLANHPEAANLMFQEGTEGIFRPAAKLGDPTTPGRSLLEIVGMAPPAAPPSAVTSPTPWTPGVPEPDVTPEERHRRAQETERKRQEDLRQKQEDARVRQSVNIYGGTIHFNQNGYDPASVPGMPAGI